MSSLLDEMKQYQLEVDQKELNKELSTLSYENKAITIINHTPIYFDIYKKWWVFNRDSFKWQSVDEIDVIGFIKKIFKLYGLSDTKERATMLNALKDEARYRKPQELNEYQIQIGKYIYDIRNDDKIIASPKYQPSIIINHEIDTVSDNDGCPYIDNLFEEWVGERKQILYDIIAFSMSPSYFLDICFWLVGAGENGKGLFTTVLNNVVGFENTTSQDLELLSDPKDRFTKTFLHNKLVCLLGDGNYQTLEHTKALKTLAGKTDPVRGEIKGGNQINFYNRAKLLGAYNTLPETSDKTNGFYRRQHITEFKNDFSGKKNPLPNVPEREYTVLAYKCFKRLKEIYKENEIMGWGTPQERKEKYEKLSNPIKLFINTEMEEDNDYYCFAKTLHKYYNAFAIKNGYNTFRYSDFEARLLNQGYEKKRKDVYSYNGFCWGKKNTMPVEVLKLLEDNEYNQNAENDVSFGKFPVIWGLKFKNVNFLDKIDKIDRFSELGALRKASNTKKVSKLSILSKNEEKIILPFDKKCIIHTKCYLCDNFECNEYDDGKNYCKEHFMTVQK